MLNDSAIEIISKIFAETLNKLIPIQSNVQPNNDVENDVIEFPTFREVKSMQKPLVAKSLSDDFEIDTVVTPARHPWALRVFWNDKHECAASIISRIWAISSANCLRFVSNYICFLSFNSI